MTAWQTIFAGLGGFAIIVTAVAWLAQKIAEQLLYRNLEKYKNDLSGESARNLERYKSDLAIESARSASELTHNLTLASQEHQLVLTQLHERRAEVVAKTYELLVHAHWAGQDLVSPIELLGGPNKHEKYIAGLEACGALFRYCDVNRIYLPSDLGEHLDKFLSDLRETMIGYGIYTNFKEDNILEATRKARNEAWEKAWKKFEKDLPEARRLLESELRSLIDPARR